MKSTVTIAIVGATATGCATAGTLASFGWQDILVLDRRKLPGTVPFPDIDPGFVFAPLTAEDDLPLLRESHLICRDLSFRGETAFDRVGSLTIATTSDGMDALTNRAAVLAAAGVEAVILTATETAMRLPLVDPARIAGSLSVPGDGIIRPHVVRAGLIERTIEPASPVRNVDAESAVIFRGDVDVNSIQQADRGWRIDSSRGAVDARFVVWTGDGAPQPLNRGPIGQPPRALYVETAPLPGLKWLADREVTLPAVHHWESGLSLRQRHSCLGILGTATVTGRNGRDQGLALAARAAELFPELGHASISTSSLVNALPTRGQPSVQSALAGGMNPMVDTGIACPPVPCGLAVGLGRRIGRDIAGDSAERRAARDRDLCRLESAPAAWMAGEGADRWASPWTADDTGIGATLH